jgi:hypothetical protein
MIDMYRVGERREVNHPVGTAVVPDADFPHAPPDIWHRLPIGRFEALLDEVKLVADLVAYTIRELAQAFNRISVKLQRLLPTHGDLYRFRYQESKAGRYQQLVLWRSRGGRHRAGRDATSIGRVTVKSIHCKRGIIRL